jgi:hypothetical protein
MDIQCLIRHNKIESNLHGEAGNMDERERMEIMLAWKTKTHQIIEDEGISPLNVFTVQTKLLVSITTNCQARCTLTKQ